ncbi:TlpA disulfide reductase family protein [Tunturibacter empetritectus]|uniref:Thiol-disulfide isomerase/thioredoxin n=1 Tax=Tunturiibacter lichenicola TaxID=2051959 RepID=A0A7W8J8T0_9BACT|nr:TlpA disulfide reductase family protein [Edaphobacter lichenicola]MBB5343424.1 thiol-disulfide isomerase/thioredoxin [Edaphobacter lichenicola]
MRRCILPATILLVSFLSLPVLGEQPSADYKSNPKFQSAITEGKQLAQHRQLSFALDAYKKANKIADGKDIDTLNEIFALQIQTGRYKDAVSSASSLESAATTPALKSRAEVNHGYTLFLQAGDKHKPELMHAADVELKAALVDNPQNASAFYLDGKILAYLGNMDAARDQFKGCLTCISPKDPSYLRAQHFADDPALVLHKMAPAFEVTALDGSKFNLDAMGGRVVLIDFWATWCGPCNEELPHVKKIAKEFAGQPLVIISVSWDSDETKWKNFINKNEMTWVQYRDADHSLSREFGVESIPHYFTIDSDGVLTAEMLGSGSDVEGKLKKLIARAKSAPQPQTASHSGN